MFWAGEPARDERSKPREPAGADADVAWCTGFGGLGLLSYALVSPMAGGFAKRTQRRLVGVEPRTFADVKTRRTKPPSTTGPLRHNINLLLMFGLILASIEDLTRCRTKPRASGFAKRTQGRVVLPREPADPPGELLAQNR
jgi:hypothetical protein